MRIRLRLSTFAAVLLVGALLAPSAFAQKPVKEPVVNDPQEFAAGEVCAFPVLLESVAGNESIKTFPSGRMLITGSGATRVTNLVSRKSVVVKTGGSVSTTPLPNGDLRIVGRGRILFFFLPQDVRGAGLLLTRGHVDEVLDADTNTITSFRLRGQSTDICAQLA